MKLLRSISIILLLIYNTTTLADNEQETAQKIFIANINSLLIFTQESGLSSGKYNFKKAGFNMHSYSLPFQYQLKSSKERINYFIDGGVGYSKTELNTQTISAGSNFTHNNKILTYTGGLGFGIRYKGDYDINYLASLGIIYSRAGVSINPNNNVGDAIQNFFDDNYNENLTYKLFLSARYEREIKGYKSYIEASFKLYKTSLGFSFDELDEIGAQSSISSLSFGIESAPLLRHNRDTITIEPYSKIIYIDGDISNVVRFNTYANIGLIAYYNTPTISLIKRFYIETSTVVGTGIEGHNIGLGFTINY